MGHGGAAVPNTSDIQYSALPLLTLWNITDTLSLQLSCLKLRHPVLIDIYDLCRRVDAIKKGGPLLLRVCCFGSQGSHFLLIGPDTVS